MKKTLSHLSFSNTTSEIVLYTTTWCPACKQAKNYLNQQNVLFKERDIEINDVWASDVSVLSNSSIPVLLTNDLKVNGYEPSAYSEVISHISNND